MAKGHHKRSTYAQSEDRFDRISALHTQGLTQEQIAARLKITRSNVAHYLRPGCKAAWRAKLKPRPAKPGQESSLTRCVWPVPLKPEDFL